MHFDVLLLIRSLFFLFNYLLLFYYSVLLQLKIKNSLGNNNNTNFEKVTSCIVVLTHWAVLFPRV